MLEYETQVVVYRLARTTGKICFLTEGKVIFYPAAKNYLPPREFASIEECKAWLEDNWEDQL